MALSDLPWSQVSLWEHCLPWLQVTTGTEVFQAVHYIWPQASLWEGLSTKTPSMGIRRLVHCDPSMGRLSWLQASISLHIIIKANILHSLPILASYFLNHTCWYSTALLKPWAEMEMRTLGTTCTWQSQWSATNTILWMFPTTHARSSTCTGGFIPLCDNDIPDLYCE